jgi:separase
MMFAQAAYLQGLIALQQGQFHHALMSCRESVRVLFQEWVRTGSQLPTDAEKTTVGEESKADVSLPTFVKDNNTAVLPTGGPDFWILFRQLFRTVLHLSTIYAQLGLFQETVYYAEMAETMARNAQSDVYVAQAATWAASVYVKAGNTEKATGLINQARSTLPTGYRSCSALSLVCQIGSVYRELHDYEAEQEMIDLADSILVALKPEPVATVTPEVGHLEKQMAKLNVKEKTTGKVRATRRTVQVPTTTTAKKATRTAAATKAKAPVGPPMTVAAAEDPYLSTFRTAISIHKAVSLLGKKDWAKAAALLEDKALLSNVPSGHICDNKKVVVAACLIGSSLEAMAHDSVFSVVHDSTLSFPTVAGAGSDRSAVERLSLTHLSPPPARKGRSTAATRKDAAKEAAQQSFVTSLLEAQKTLLEAHAEVALTGDAGLLHRVSAMLQTVTLVLSTVTTKGKTINQVAHGASSADLARNLTWRRERKAILQEKHNLKADGNGWPSLISSPEEPKRTSLGFSTDLNKFQRDYVDIIPKTWTTLSISLSENKHDLCITRLQAGHSPFVIRLPLERASSRDADTEVFNFQQGRAELLEIIRLANQTCHDARDMTVKENKAAWWADREDLDKRLKELLDNMERDWLGGFRGIFSQHTRRADLLARFQKSFQNILDKHLPSHRQVRGRKGKATSTTTAATGKITLDPRILDLFVGLGNPAAEEEDCDFDDALTDLLYFVVDILQFHGERNAYDEIDFDAMVVDTLDALHAYHSAGKTETSWPNNTHTILVLDKALHTFPWESLPCMRGQAVSRVPSLACLRRLILEQQPASSKVSDAPAGHHIPCATGTYILNPSRDLKSTQTTFSRPLSTHLPTWAPILAREPTEPEFVKALTLPSSILLYFGHGSGAQYIRGKAIRRLDPGVKAVSLLWGCSSAKLEDCGEFECHGTVWNYLMAGCPAVTGTLWDVTDRDIDRFAGRTLEGWGLLPGGSVKVEDGRKTKGAVRGRKEVRESGREGQLSLVEAVAAAREGACRFRYLTAASVVVYGIPVYVDRKE